jgi:DNA polymerase-3 subunit beta
MKVVLQAKPLAAALDLAASMLDAKLKRIVGLGHVRLTTEGNQLIVTANVLDFALRTSLPATIEADGEVAIKSEQLAALAGGFPGDAGITIASDETMASIVCGRSRFKVPMLPLELLPSTPAIENETGGVTLERRQLLALLSTAFAMTAEQTRFYLYGVFMHDTAEGLAAVATDGHRLARAVLPGVAGLSQDRRLIVPKPAIKILLKLLADKEVELLTLRRSVSLLQITSARFTFTSKLIDAEYPSYERLVSVSTDNAVTVDRVALTQAAARIAAVALNNKRLSLVGLTWTAPEPSLRLCIAGMPDLADDLIEAEASGNGRFAVQIKHLAQLLDEIGSERVRIDAGAGVGSAILITDPDDANFTIVQMPCLWGIEASDEAA